MYWPKAVADSVLALENPFFRHELAFPMGQDVTLVTWNVALQGMLIPVTAWADPVTALNLSALTILVLNALAFGWAGRSLSDSAWGGLFGVVVGATAAGALAEIGRGHMDQAFLAPQAIFFAALFKRQRALAAVALALAGAVYWFNALFLALLALVVLAALRRKELARDLAQVGGASLIVVLPLLVPVLLARFDQPEVLALVEDPGPVAQLRESASLVLASFGGPWAPARIARGLHLRPSILLLPLLAVGAWRLRGEGRALSIAGLVALLLALGPTISASAGAPLLPGPSRLLHMLPAFEQLRWPARWALQALPLGALVGAMLLARHPRVLAVAALLLVVEARFAATAPIPLGAPMIELQGPVVQVPSSRLPNGFVGVQALHGQPIDGGIGFQFPELRELHHRDIELLDAIAAIERGQAAEPDPDWGPFRHVVLYPLGPKPEQNRLQSDLHALLGSPSHKAPDLVVWTR